jgi:hypothetical protein
MCATSPSPTGTIRIGSIWFAILVHSPQPSPSRFFRGAWAGLGRRISRRRADRKVQPVRVLVGCFDDATRRLDHAPTCNPKIRCRDPQFFQTEANRVRHDRRDNDGDLSEAHWCWAAISGVTAQRGLLLLWTGNGAVIVPDQSFASAAARDAAIAFIRARRSDAASAASTPAA